MSSRYSTVLAVSVALLFAYLWFTTQEQTHVLPGPVQAQEKANSKIRWEPLGGDLYRTKVPGGWLVKFQHHPTVYRSGSPVDQFGGITFYPDPKHEWDGATLP